MNGIAVAIAAVWIWASAGDPADPGSPAPAAEAAGPAGVGAPLPAPRARESVGSLFAESPGTGRTDETTGSGLLFRMLGWVAALGIAAFAAVRIWKRFAPVGRLGGIEGGGLRVVARTNLTSRHSIYAVRVGNARLLVVGVSGDRIAPLTEVDDPAAVVSFDPSFGKALEAAGAPAREEGGDVDSRLGSFRSEVQRLRELVRGWRGKLGRPAAGESVARTEGSAAGRA